MHPIRLLFVFLLCFSAAAAEKDSLRAAAESGSADAQFRLANEYFTGTPGRKRNFTLAAYWFRRVADRGYPEAMFNYALCLDQGLGVEADPYKAAEYYAKAAEKGRIPQAVFNHAQILRFGVRPRSEAEEKKKPADYHFEPDEKTALFLLEKLSDSSFAPAQAELAEILLRKEGRSDADLRKARSLLDKAALDPNAPAKTFRMLADCCYGGLGGKPDPAGMILNLRKAAELGDGEAMVKLAFCLEHGLNTAPDEAEARTLYRAAARLGIPEAMYKFARSIEAGYEKNAGPGDALEWYRRAAKLNHPASFFRLGELSEQGAGAAADPRAAVRLFMEAAKLGYPRAQYRIGRFFLGEGDFLVRDPGAAYFWFREGASRGDTPSMRALAKCCLEGTGCTPNRAEAVRWLAEAAKNGDVLAEEELKSLQF